MIRAWLERLAARPGRAAAALTALVVVTSLPSFWAGGFLDDWSNLLHARDADWTLRSLGQALRFNLAELHDGVVPAFFDLTVRFFRPLAMASLKLDHRLFDRAFVWYHLQNVLWHLVVVLLVWRLGIEVFGGDQRAVGNGSAVFGVRPPRGLGLAVSAPGGPQAGGSTSGSVAGCPLPGVSTPGSVAGCPLPGVSTPGSVAGCPLPPLGGPKCLPGRVEALAGAGLFALCFLNVMTVIWLSTRGELLSVAFILGALLVSLRLPLVQDRTWVRRGALALSLGSMALGLLAKELAAVVPLLVGAGAWWQAREAGATSRRAAREALRRSWPFFLLLVPYFLLRASVVGPLSLPVAPFYFFPVTSWLFPYFVFQKLVYALLWLIAFVPAPPARLLMGFPLYHVVFIPAALAFLYGVVRLIAPVVRGEPGVRLLVPCFLLAFLPTLPITLFPHYLYLPSVFYCLILARVLLGSPSPGGQAEPGQGPAEGLAEGPLAGRDADVSGRHPWRHAGMAAIVPVGAGGRGGLAARAYLVLYLVALVVSLALITSLFGLASRSTERMCGRLAAAYDRFLAGPGARDPRAAVEFYLFDLPADKAHLFPEFRLRYPDRTRFKGFFVNLADPLMPPSRITADTGQVVVRAAGHPFYASPFIFFLVGQLDPRLVDGTYSCPSFRITLTGKEPHPQTGFTGAREIRLQFDPRHSPPDRRFGFRGIPDASGTYEIALHP